jgi:ATPase subunit of ABC transporter with duplicated ATPase domains
VYNTHVQLVEAPQHLMSRVPLPLACPSAGCLSIMLQEYIARFGHGSAKLARQAQSKEKTLEKMVRSGLTEKVETDRVVRLRFENVGKLPPPVLQFSGVAFGYSPNKVLYR